MSDISIGWKVYETMGIGFINPIIYVYEVIKRNIETANEDNFPELIKLCLSYAPNRADRIFSILDQNFPEYKYITAKYKLLI